MGSAIKGVYFVHGHLIGVGYDQRLSLWKVEIDATLRRHDNDDIKKDSCITYEVTRVPREKQREKAITPQEYTTLSSSTAPTSDRSINLRWLEGSVVQIGDVNALYVDVDEYPDGSSEANAVAIGEGCQLFKIKLD